MGLPNSIQAQNYDGVEEIVFVESYTDMKNEKRNALNRKRNAIMQEVVKDYWSLNMNYKFMVEKEAYKYARSTKGKTIVAEFTSTETIGTMKAESNLDFRDARTRKILSVRLPAYRLKKVDLVYAVMHSQFMFKNASRWKKPSKELPKEYGHILSEKTLLVSEEDLSKHFSETALKSAYPHKYKVVSNEELNEAIFSKSEDYIVLYRASEAGNVSNATYAYWNIYQPTDGVVISRHSGNPNGLSKSDVDLFVKRTSH